MSYLNPYQKQFINETTQKLSSAMEKFKFTKTMSRDEADAIRRDLEGVQGSIFTYEDINGSNQHIEIFKATVVFLEKMLKTLTGDMGHLV